jgi:hypothetical protein
VELVTSGKLGKRTWGSQPNRSRKGRKSGVIDVEGSLGLEVHWHRWMTAGVVTNIYIYTRDMMDSGRSKLRLVRAHSV